MHVVHDRVTYRFRELGRHSVSDQDAHISEGRLLALWDEAVLSREGLKNGRFAKADGAVLLRVSEPAIPEAVKLGRYRRRGGVPLHTAVH